MTTDIKAIINSIEIVGTSSGPRLSIDWPERGIEVTKENASDIAMLGRFIEATIKEMDMETLCESHVDVMLMMFDSMRNKK